MIEIGNAKIFSNHEIDGAIDQVREIENTNMYNHIRVMPDYHSGKGCVIGFTSKITDKVVSPSLVGSDIACGVVAKSFKDYNFTGEQFKMLDAFVQETVNSLGKDSPKAQKIIDELKCKDKLKDIGYLCDSLGTLGSGNHFLSLEKGNEGIYLVVHSGSRNLGMQVYAYYQEQFDNRSSDMICENPWFNDYLHDMTFVNEYAEQNRLDMLNRVYNFITDMIGESCDSVSISSIHNYIDTTYGYVRKGAISAQKNEKVIIPLNMRDGTIIGVGKGNEEWNFSGPHGAGRYYSRSSAKKAFNVDEFKEQMKGIYTSSTSEKFIDESPMAYKPVEHILEVIGESVDVTEIIKPIYVFKN